MSINIFHLCVWNLWDSWTKSQMHKFFNREWSVANQMAALNFTVKILCLFKTTSWLPDPHSVSNSFVYTYSLWDFWDPNQKRRNALLPIKPTLYYFFSIFVVMIGTYSIFHGVLRGDAVDFLDGVRGHIEPWWLAVINHQHLVVFLICCKTLKMHQWINCKFKNTSFSCYW